MRFTKAFLMLFLIGTIFLPETAAALRTMQAFNPCGKVICCCPAMCKQIKKKAAHCLNAGVMKCGIQSAAAPSNTVWTLASGTERVPLLSTRADGFILLRTDFRPKAEPPADSISQAPLDKPPARLA